MKKKTNAKSPHPRPEAKPSAEPDAMTAIATALGVLADNLDLDNLPHRIEELADNLNYVGQQIGSVGDGLERVQALSTIATCGTPEDRELAIRHLKKYFSSFDDPDRGD